MVDAPVVVIAFNRPDLVQQVFDRVREAAPSRLFLLADGPRPGNPTDPEQCAAVRGILDAVDWPCQVERRFSEGNLGVDANIELGLDWVFSQVDRAIILEDDCLPDLTFFRFCDELLERYSDDERIGQISGNRLLVPPDLFSGHSYALTSWASVWGWASWSRSWQAHRDLFPRDHAARVAGGPRAVPERPEPASFAPGVLLTRGGHRYFMEVAQTGRADLFTWDNHWWVSLLALGRLCVTPAADLVQNVGFGEGATSTRSSRELPEAVAMEFPLSHPDQVRLNPEVERELELVMVRANGRLARQVRRVVRALWLRGVVRRVLSWEPGWRLVRKVSKAVSRG